MDPTEGCYFQFLLVQKSIVRVNWWESAFEKLRKEDTAVSSFSQTFRCCRVGTEYTWSNFIYNFPDEGLPQYLNQSMIYDL